VTVPDETRLSESQYSLFLRRHLDANAGSRAATSTTLVPISRLSEDARSLSS
jgi:hypothetical protein